MSPIYRFSCRWPSLLWLKIARQSNSLLAQRASRQAQARQTPPPRLCKKGSQTSSLSQQTGPSQSDLPCFKSKARQAPCLAFWQIKSNQLCNNIIYFIVVYCMLLYFIVFYCILCNKAQ